jgi:molybdopterin-guanine dinucleotide biosynthesis protein MobB
MAESLTGRVIGVVGWKDSGKTLVVERLVTSLVQRGLRVGTVKHVHEAPSLQPAATDSARHLGAGAEISLVLGNELMLLSKHEGEDLETAAARYLPLCDFIVVEGFKHAKIPKVAVISENDDILREVTNVVAVVCRDSKPEGYEAFTADRIEDLVNFLFESEALRPSDRRVTLLVNGKPVPINEFVQASLAGVVRGFITSLHDVESPSTIQLTITLRGQVDA